MVCDFVPLDIKWCWRVRRAWCARCSRASGFVVQGVVLVVRPRHGGAVRLHIRSAPTDARSSRNCRSRTSATRRRGNSGRLSGKPALPVRRLLQLPTHEWDCRTLRSFLCPWRLLQLPPHFRLPMSGHLPSTVANKSSSCCAARCLLRRRFRLNGSVGIGEPKKCFLLTASQFRRPSK